MPNYEYVCSACRAHLEMQQGIHDAAMRRCPACMRDTLMRMINPAALRFKGAGWTTPSPKDS